MKVNYIDRTEIPKRRYTKWNALLDEFQNSESTGMELIPEGLTANQVKHMRNSIILAVKRMKLPVKVHKIGQKIYLEKMI